MRSVHKVLIAIFFLFSLFSLAAEDWRSVKREENIIVYTRGMPDKGIEEFKAVTAVPASPEDVKSLFDDVDSYPHWFGDCTHAEELGRSGKDSKEVYIIMDVPWPAEDRDVTVMVRFYSRSWGYHGIIKNVDGLISTQKDLVRVPYLRGQVVLRREDNNNTEVTYQVAVDPGGELPYFLVAGFMREHPFKTLLGLRKQSE
jgi:ribosome-associated toxin RatA of RatAB toxin-antitoxin module